ncbi:MULTISPECIES: alpha/beta hydrolase [Streptomyces]|uniref:alpha/beta hydrolase n=1 Tax=Streptomyces sp. SID5473 TaxID=2690299 RepID=UPI001E625173|nr:alpha/beta hydrolase [Streptomyces tsukubensis]
MTSKGVGYGLVAGLGSLVLSALTVTPATGTAVRGSGDAVTPEARGTAVAAARAAERGIAFGDCPAAEGLPETVTCGTVEVPLDYAEPGGRRIALTVSRIAATGESGDYQGALVYNPGGPGASSMYFPLAGQLQEWKRIARAYDLIGYAPRGVGRSAPLSCQEAEESVRAPTASETHPSPAFKRARIAEAREYADGCARRTGDALRHYTSLNNARDLDVLRAALGQERLTFMGASYGTYFGALYATLFPSHVRRMVFDSAVHPARDKIWYRNNLDQSFAFERRWADFRAWVARHDDTFGLGTTAGAVARRYEEAKSRVAKEPAGGIVGPAQLQSAFLGAAYYDDYWPARASALSEYLKGNEKPLIRQAAPKKEWAAESENSNAVYTAILCNDAPWPTEWKVWDRDNTALARKAPFETWDNAWMNLPCAFWRAPRQQPLEVRTRWGALPPVLILAAEHDAATPYEGAKELARRLKGSVLITEEDAGTHGVGGGANDCVNAYLEDYLLRGEAPVRRASCAPHPEPDPVSLEQRTLRPQPLRPAV